MERAVEVEAEAKFASEVAEKEEEQESAAEEAAAAGDESAVVSLQKDILPEKPRALRRPRSRANIKNSASVLLVLYDPSHALKRDVAQTLWCVRQSRCW